MRVDFLWHTKENLIIAKSILFHLLECYIVPQCCPHRMALFKTCKVWSSVPVGEIVKCFLDYNQNSYAHICIHQSIINLPL